ncbi:MAG: hypothetical protein AB1696_24160 [Planctomycetota bacterium]
MINTQKRTVYGWGMIWFLWFAMGGLGCAGVEVEVYRKPSHDFHSYEKIAVVPLSPPGREIEDREHAQMVTALLCERLIKENYSIIDVDTATARLRQAGIRVDGQSDEALLQKAAVHLGVRAVLTGDLEFCGPFDYQVPPSQVPYGYYDWYGYPRRGYYYEPGYTATGSRAAMTIKLFDADVGNFVWWAKGDRSGAQRIAQHYAKEVIEKAVEKLRAKPKKRDKKKDDK